MKKRELQEITSYFDNDGVLIKWEPINLQHYQSKYIHIKGRLYDMTNKKDIEELPVIPITQKAYSENGITNQYEYILRMVASNIRDTYSHELSLLIMRKAHHMMHNSYIRWLRKDFFRLVVWLLQDGKYDEAMEEIEIIKRNVMNVKQMCDHGYSELIKYCKKNNLHYIKALNINAICDKCADLLDRYYCIDGYNKKLPTLENYKCHCPISFIYQVYLPDTFTTRDGREVYTIRYSNRPFSDIRSYEEKELYLKLQDERIEILVREQRKCDYDVLKALFPNECPRSFYAFCKIYDNDYQEFKRLSKLIDNYKISPLIYLDYNFYYE